MEEMQLVDPLYEPTIMYSVKDIPYCKKHRDEYKKRHKKEFIDHYEKSFRLLLLDKIKNEDGKKYKTLRDELEDLNINIDCLTSLSDLTKRLRLEKARGKRAANRARSELSEILEEEIEDCPFPEENGFCTKKSQPYSLDYDNALKELYDIYKELINTFEMQRLKHLQMTGFLSFKYPSSTHTRFAHVVGTWISGLIALQNVTVVIEEGKEERLIEFLADEDMHREFMAALILHDIGHAPFSHVLEMNPHLKYNHEEITKQLIGGGEAYLILEDILVSSYIDLEYKYDKRYGVIPGILDVSKNKIRRKENFVLVHDVIESMGLDKDIIVDLFSDEKTNDWAVEALRGLIHGVVDIDRIDHIYRDLHYNSFKTMGIPLTSLFHGMKIHCEENEPYIEISEKITPIIETLITAREQSQKAIFDNPVNNFYIAVLNSGISDAIRMFPLIKYYIPYLTDEALLHILQDRELFHNLSPTEKASIITGSSFGHRDYVYSIYIIRNGEKIPNSAEEKETKEIIASATEDIGEGRVFWYAFLKDTRHAYESKCEYIGKREQGKGDNKLGNKLKKYIDGITWDSSVNRSWTFTLFAKEGDKDRIKEVKKEVEDKIKGELGNINITPVFSEERVR